MPGERALDSTTSPARQEGTQKGSGRATVVVVYNVSGMKQKPGAVDDFKINASGFVTKADNSI